MKRRSIFSKAIITSTCLLTTGLIVAQQTHFSLQHGDYVQEPLACKDAPFAAMMSWNGIGFSDPHSSQCRSRVATQSSNRYHLITTCAALGDGTPDNSGYVEKFTVTRLSNKRFELTKAAKPAGIYRWCNASVPAAPSEKP